MVRAFKAGAHDFIEKPYNEQLLLDSVQQALSNCAANRSGNQGHDALQARLLTLTPRERDVLLPLVQGYTTREIAEQLGVHAGQHLAGPGGHGDRRATGRSVEAALRPRVLH
ncbi:Transcriptional regulatory protein FixJ [compost metagenome]